MKMIFKVYKSTLVQACYNMIDKLGEFEGHETSTFAPRDNLPKLFNKNRYIHRIEN